MSAVLEKKILNDCLVEVSMQPQTMVWRNNTGTGWQGERIAGYPGMTVRIERGMVVLRNARSIRFGLPGSADIMGVSAGRAIAGECKAGTRQSGQQSAFEEAFTAAGGHYGLWRSTDDALNDLRRWGCI